MTAGGEAGDNNYRGLVCIDPSVIKLQVPGQAAVMSAGGQSGRVHMSRVQEPTQRGVAVRVKCCTETELQIPQCQGEIWHSNTGGDTKLQSEVVWQRRQRRCKTARCDRTLQSGWQRLLIEASKLVRRVSRNEGDEGVPDRSFMTKLSHPPARTLAAPPAAQQMQCRHPSGSVQVLTLR